MSILKLYRSPRGFAILPVHFSADPSKRSPEWALEERKKFETEADWQREMEIDFSAQLGAACYVDFRRELHVVDDLPFLTDVPLDVCMDFNVSPGAWVLSQVVGGIENVIDEIVLDPANTEMMVREFRNRYPTHKAELHVYGDATGNERGSQTARTNYDLVRIHFAGYPAPLVFYVPLKNPSQKSRVLAVNRRLRGANAISFVRISSRCMHLIKDLQEVVWRPDGKEIFKVFDGKNPYSKRTHTSDAWGYKIHRLWPVISEALRLEHKPLPPRPQPKHYLGKI